MTLDLPMPVERVYADPQFITTGGVSPCSAARSSTAWKRGQRRRSGRAVAAARGRAVDAAFEPELLGGVVVLRGQAERISDRCWGRQLYRTSRPRVARCVTAVPYFAWDNRAPGEMQVWIREA